MTVLELKGYQSLRAMNVFHTLMLGLKMLPAYLTQGYEEFFSRVQNEMSPSEQEKLIREAALFVRLDEDEIKALICFTADPNGVPYTAENIKNLSPDQIYEAIVAVCFQISQIKINLITETEKKKSKMVPSISGAPISSGLIRRFLNWLISLF